MKAVNKTAETGEQASSVQYTNRHPWGDFSLLNSLTPERLAAILADVRRGECPAEYLELSQDIELRDLHYHSVLSTRKDAITGLEIKVIPAGEDDKDTELAAAVERDIVKNPSAKLRSLIRDMLDALGKGFSVNEIVWDTGRVPWKPKAYKFRDPHWFQYDRETGDALMLRAPYGNDLEPLKPFQFIVHEPHLISGKQITAGLALPALYFWMLKTYDITSWAAFIDRYGYPIRIGKYGKKFTDEDRKTLMRAVAAIGQDFGAIIPESAQLEIIESKHTGEMSNVLNRLINASDTPDFPNFEAVRRAWNDPKRKLPEFRRTALQLNSYERDVICRQLNIYSEAEIIGGIENYAYMKLHPDDFDIKHNYASLLNFIEKGRDTFTQPDETLMAQFGRDKK